MYLAELNQRSVRLEHDETAVHVLQQEELAFQNHLGSENNYDITKFCAVRVDVAEPIIERTGKKISPDDKIDLHDLIYIRQY